jgi:hypothetical protein
MAPPRRVRTTRHSHSRCCTRAAALATASNWIFTFLVVEITPVSISSIGWRTYVYFGVFNASFLPLIYFFYPETRGLSLENIDKLFTGGKVTMHWKESWGEAGDIRRPSVAEDTKDPTSEMIEKRTLVKMTRHGDYVAEPSAVVEVCT